MKTSEMSNSKYLKAHDVDPPKLVTIRKIEQVNVAQEGKPREMKWILCLTNWKRPWFSTRPISIVSREH
jgi:hypothetical protein